MPRQGIVLLADAHYVNRYVKTTDLAEEVFHMSVRLGTPQRVQGLSDVVKNPIHATGVGLLEFGNRSQPRPGIDVSNNDNSFAQVWERMKAWFQGNF